MTEEDKTRVRLHLMEEKRKEGNQCLWISRACKVVAVVMLIYFFPLRQLGLDYDYDDDEWVFLPLIVIWGILYFVDLYFQRKAQKMKDAHLEIEVTMRAEAGLAPSDEQIAVLEGAFIDYRKQPWRIPFLLTYIYYAIVYVCMFINLKARDIIPYREETLILLLGLLLTIGPLLVSLFLHIRPKRQDVTL